MQLLDVTNPREDVSVGRNGSIPPPPALSPLQFFSRSAHLTVLVACLIFASGASAQRVNSSNAPPPHRTFTVVLDAAHGGSNLGAKLSSALDEKTVTLTLALHLRSLLAVHGVSVIMTRTTDTDLPMATRAGIANHAHAAACIVLHATATGAGIHLFTSSLAPAPPSVAPAWETAQAAYVEQSVRFSSDIDAAFEHTSIPIVVGRTFLRPLDNLTCPAIAIELAPKPATGLASAKSVNDLGYQSAALNAIVAGVLQWRQDWNRHL